MKQPDNPEDEIRSPDSIIVRGLIQQASFEGILELCKKIAAQAGITEIDGLPVYSWFQKMKLEKLDELLIGLEDCDPALAAKFQAKIDEIKRRTGN
jgi:hypothetical protein